ncbi:MAG: hypothetical protein WCW13_05265 [archaeon]|jgi:hypothetical protein
MVWGWEYIAGFNPFEFSALRIINSIIFLFVFGYLSARGTKENPWEEALEIMGYLMVVAFALALLDLPPLWMGVGYIAAYLIIWQGLKKKRAFDWGFFVVYLAYVFATLAILDDLTRTWYVIAFVVLLFIQSEIKIREMKKEEPKKESAKK